MADASITMDQLEAARSVSDAVVSDAQAQMSTLVDGLVKAVDTGGMTATDAAGMVRAYAEDLGVQNNKVMAEIGNQLLEKIRAAEIGTEGYAAVISTDATAYQGAHDVYTALKPMFDEANFGNPLSERLEKSREPVNAALGAEMRRAQKDNMLANLNMDYQQMVDAGMLDQAGEIGYAVVPRGATCSWCTVMASRGFVYLSRETAKKSAVTSAAFHKNCDCSIVPGYRGSVRLAGYDADRYYQYYADARRAWKAYQGGDEEIDAALAHAADTDIAHIQVFMRRMYGMS